MKIFVLLRNDTIPCSGTTTTVVVSYRPQHATLVSSLPPRTAISREVRPSFTCILSENEIEVRKFSMSRRRTFMHIEPEQAGNKRINYR